MSVISGVNNYVIEGGKYKELYDQFVAAMDKCQELDTEYDLGEYRGKRYVIKKEFTEGKDGELPNYILMVLEGEECVAFSYFDDNCLRRKRGCLYFTEEWCDIEGGFENFVIDSELYREEGFYFESYNSEDMAGYSNDAEGKYFQPSLVYYGIKLPELEQLRADGKISEKEYLRKYKEQEAKIMKGFDSLSPAEQIEFCNARKDKIYFNITEIVDCQIWFARYADE